MSHTTLPSAPTIGRNTRGLVLLSIGMALSLAAVVLLGVTLLGIATLQSDALARMNEENISYWASFGLVERQLSTLSMMSAMPGVLLLAATCFLIPGYLRRRGSIMEGELKFWRGGSNTAKYKPLPLVVHAAWLLVPLAAWLLLVVIPLGNLIGGNAWPAGLQYENADAVWLLLGLYGGLAAAMFAVVLVSLLKKIVYLRHIIRHPDDINGGASKGFWRWLTFRWRFDLWLSGIGGAFIGLCWIALGFDDLAFTTTALGIGIVFFVLGAALSMNYWKAGEPLGAAESYS